MLYFATAAEDEGSTVLFDLDIGEERYFIEIVTNFYSGEIISPEGKYYDAFQSDHLEVWDSSTAELVTEFGESYEEYTEFTWTLDGKTIALENRYVSTYQESLEIRNITSGNLAGKTDLLVWATASSYFDSENYLPYGLLFEDSIDDSDFNNIHSDPGYTNIYDD